LVGRQTQKSDAMFAIFLGHVRQRLRVARGHRTFKRQENNDDGFLVLEIVKGKGFSVRILEGDIGNLPTEIVGGRRGISRRGIEQHQAGNQDQRDDNGQTHREISVERQSILVNILLEMGRGGFKKTMGSTMASRTHATILKVTLKSL